MADRDSMMADYYRLSPAAGIAARKYACKARARDVRGLADPGDIRGNAGANERAHALAFRCPRVH